jgi:hypothetical protein
MKAVLIDPMAKTVNIINLPSVRGAITEFFGERPTPVLRLPRGDVILAAKAAAGVAFAFGGSRPIGGAGLIVGRSLGMGERASSCVDPFQAAQMVRWTNLEKSDAPEVRAAVRAIEINPQRQSIEEFSIAPTMLAMRHRLGGEVTVCYRAPGGDVVLCGVDAATDLHGWQKDDAEFQGRCILIGRDPRKRFADAAVSLVKLREDVSFRAPTPAAGERPSVTSVDTS